MKATGIVRRIDDLGRVVIPKEIRRTMRIREGDPLEIFTDREGEVIFKKYSPIGEMNTLASQYAQALNRTCTLNIVITDRDSIIAYAGVPKKDYQDKTVSKDIEEIIESRTLYTYEEGKEKLAMVEDANEFYASVVMPIITEGDIIGCVASLHREGETTEIDFETEKKLVMTASAFLSKQLES